MGLFIRDDSDYNESVRMTGFNRYKQLLSFFAGHWTKLNLITTISAIPLIFGISFAIMNKSLLVMLPLSFLGGVILGPFVSALFDSIQRGLREDTNNRWDNYKKGFRQNLHCSLLPGGILGLVIGTYCFFFYILYWTGQSLSPATIALLLFSFFLIWDIFILYFVQLVLFHQTFFTRMRNIVLFTAKYLWKMLLISAISGVFLAIIILFAPYTLLIVPFIGIWYILFLSQFIIYDDLNQELKIEELYNA